MLNIINKLRKNEINLIYHDQGESIREYKRDVPLSKEWYNSLYSFKKNSIRWYPAIHNYVFKLLNIYFNMNGKGMETVPKSRKYKKLKRLSGKKVWISTPEIKHLNDKMVISVYVYNKIYNFYKQELNLSELSWEPNFVDESLISDDTVTLIKMPLNIKYSSNVHFKSSIKTQSFYVNIIKWLKLEKNDMMEEFKLDVNKLITDKDDEKLAKGLDMLKIERYNYLINMFKKELAYLKLKQKILFNEFKFSELYSNLIIKFLEEIYKKKIELNIVSLRNYYLSMSITSQILATKIRSLRNRGNPLRPISYAIAARIPYLNKKLQSTDKKTIGLQNTIVNNFSLVEKKQDFLNEFLLTTSDKSKYWSSENVESIALKNINNKGVIGVSIKIAGRLTKRYKAQRAVSKVNHRGSLKNFHSAHKGFSSALSRGYSNINIEKTMIHSKTRIGAFGLTGWLASY